MKQHEKTLKALANKRRLQIVKFLKGRKEANVGDIADHIKLSLKSTSRHLAILSSADILEREQRSLSVFYSLTPRATRLVKAIISIV